MKIKSQDTDNTRRAAQNAGEAASRQARLGLARQVPRRRGERRRARAQLVGRPGLHGQARARGRPRQRRRGRELVHRVVRQQARQQRGRHRVSLQLHHLRARATGLWVAQQKSAKCRATSTSAPICTTCFAMRHASGGHAMCKRAAAHPRPGQIRRHAAGTSTGDCHIGRQEA